MTLCLPPPDLQPLLAEIRALTQRYMAGVNPGSFHAFRDLVQLLLSKSILPTGAATRLTKGPRPDVHVLGGWNGPTDPLPLTNGNFLGLAMKLSLRNTEEGPRVKVETSKFQYQLDKEGDRWVFRYDYVREPPDPHPSAHVHVRGSLTEQCLAHKQTLDDVHFPTNRISIESVIRLLIEQFNVPPSSPPEIWRPLLAESEALFMKIAHTSLSGPVR